MHHRYGGHPMDFFGGFPLVSFLLYALGIIVILALIVTGIYLFVRRNSDSQQESSTNRSLEILQERFAKGEIDEEEYRRRKRVLEEDL